MTSRFVLEANAHKLGDLDLEGTRLPLSHAEALDMARSLLKALPPLVAAQLAREVLERSEVRAAVVNDLEAACSSNRSIDLGPLRGLMAGLKQEK